MLVFICNRYINNFTIFIAGVGTLKICKANFIGILEFSNCRSKGTFKEYSGKVNRTITGIPCVPWKDFEILIPTKGSENIEFNTNYCKSILDQLGPWCFVRKSPSVYEKHYCPIRKCENSRLNCRFVGYPIPDVTQNVAVSGEHCMSWLEMSRKYTHLKRYGDDKFFKYHKNYCRNFDKDLKDSWCYTRGFGNPKRYCSIKTCMLVSVNSKCRGYLCETAVDGVRICARGVFYNGSILMTLELGMAVEIVAIRIHFSEKLDHIHISTSNDNKTWFICAYSYQIEFETPLTLECLYTAIYIRIESQPGNTRKFRICEVEVYVDQPPQRPCSFDGLQVLGYSGTLSKTEAGHKCEYWTTNPYYNIFPDVFLYGDLKHAQNFCRSFKLTGNLSCLYKGKLANCNKTTNCSSTLRPVKCTNPCYGLLINQNIPCDEIAIKDLVEPIRGTFGIPVVLQVVQAHLRKYYFILLLSKYFPIKPNLSSITDTTDLNIEYVAKSIPGFELQHGIAPIRNINYVEWMQFYKANTQTLSGWMYLLALVFETVDYTKDVQCEPWITARSTKLQDIQNFGFLNTISASVYFIKLN